VVEEAAPVVEDVAEPVADVAGPVVEEAGSVVENVAEPVGNAAVSVLQEAAAQDGPGLAGPVATPPAELIDAGESTRGVAAPSGTVYVPASAGSYWVIGGSLTSGVHAVEAGGPVLTTAASATFLTMLAAGPTRGPFDLADQLENWQALCWLVLYAGPWSAPTAMTMLPEVVGAVFGEAGLDGLAQGSGEGTSPTQTVAAEGAVPEPGTSKEGSVLLDLIDPSASFVLAAALGAVALLLIALASLPRRAYVGVRDASTADGVRVALLSLASAVLVALAVAQIAG
jgi:hypothetical protein